MGRHEHDEIPSELTEVDERLRNARPAVDPLAVERARSRAHRANTSAGPRRRLSIAAAAVAATIGLGGAGLAAAGASPLAIIDLGGVQQNATTSEYEAQRYLIEAGLTIGDLQAQANIIACQDFVALVDPLLPALSGACPLLAADVLLLEASGLFSSP